MPNLKQIEFKPSQIDANGLKNRFGGPPRHHFGQSSCFKHLKKTCFLMFWCPEGDFGFLFGPQSLPKLRPKCEKCDVEKQHDFCIIFVHGSGMVLRSFFVIFWRGKFAEACKVIRQKSLQNTGHGDKIKGRPFWNFSELKKIEKIIIFCGLQFRNPIRRI